MLRMNGGRKTRRDLRAAQVVWRVRWGVCIQLVIHTLVTPTPALPLKVGGRENERAGRSASECMTSLG